MRNGYAVQMLILATLVAGLLGTAQARQTPKHRHHKKRAHAAMMNVPIHYCPACKADLSATKPKGASMPIEINGKTYYCTNCGEMMKMMHDKGMKKM